MEKLAQGKLESLKKYVPFIDFLLEIDKQKYIKFINIRKWIMLGKRKYPIGDLNKIERSITTQYKNLIVENNVKIPEKIANIFAPMNFKQFVNLCSDEEDDEIQEDNKITTKVNNNNNTNTTTNKQNVLDGRRCNLTENNAKLKKNADSDDDDLEIVSIHYLKDSEKKTELDKPDLNANKVAIKQDIDYDDLSTEIFNKIDKLVEDDLKMKNTVHEPVNYMYQEKDFSELSHDKSRSDEDIYQRRTTTDELLFKRRSDFKEETQKSEIDNIIDAMKDDEVEVHIFEHSKEGQKYTNRPIEIISLDSCSDDDVPSSSKTAALKNSCNNVNDATTNSKNVTVEENEQKNVKNSNGGNKKVDELCESIDSVFLDMDEIMDELIDTKEKTKVNTINNEKLPEKKIVSECISDNNKEKTIQPTVANSSERNVTLSEEQILKLLDGITTQSDFELDTFYAALDCVKQMNITTHQGNPMENNTSVPPPPPPIVNNFSTPPIQFLQQQQQNKSSAYPLTQPTHIGYLPQQPPQQIAPNLTPHYPQNIDLVHASNSAPPPQIPRPKINVNDPRIKKHLQAIQNSPLFSHFELNSETAASIMQICQNQAQQLKKPNCQTLVREPSKSDLNLNTAAKPNCITYGDYKRWKQEKNLETERKREEEQKLLNKNKQDIRSKLLSTLNPCREQLTTLWNQQKNSHSNHKDNNTQKPLTTKENDRVVANDGEENSSYNGTCNKKPQSRQSKITKEAQIKENKTSSNVEQKLNRVYNELKCTVKGFDCLNDYISTVGEDSSERSNGFNISAVGEAASTPAPIGLRRRSSIYALSAISEQLAQQSSDCSDNDLNQSKKRNKSKRRLTETSVVNVSKGTTCSIPKRKKTIDEILQRPKRRSTALRMLDDDASTTSSTDSPLSGDDLSHKYSRKDFFGIKEPIIKLHRISPEFIRKHTKRREDDDGEETDFFTPRLRKSCEKIPITVEPAQKANKLKRYNNDCQMTERNTVLCVLCKSKPSDLTNHYIGRHKTESYVSRLGWSELDDLQINTPFAKLHPKSKNYRFDRYEIECTFCNEKLLEPFMNLYHHYSAHTGEYAFQCSHCHLTKPYRPDIQSHILHSKTCRNSTTQIVYRYPPNTQCIYLHYCTICNFVQLNEANVLKHLREHHNHTKDIASNVQKCILVAMNDGPDVNETNKLPKTTPASTVQLQSEITATKSDKLIRENASSNGIRKSVEKSHVENYPREIKSLTTTVKTTTSTELQFKIDDDDIPVNNEPCLMDDFSEEEQFKLLMHEGSAITSPMTVIHCMTESTKNSAGVIQNPTGNIISSLSPQPAKNLKTFSDRHLPIIIKTENVDIEESLLVTPPRKFLHYNRVKDQTPQPVTQRNQPTVYEKYRSYPQNVKYLGLYKCMIDDCYYSTDCSKELCNHLTDHLAEEVKPIESLLQCPYCVIPMATVMTPQQLVEHIRAQHGHSIYQCSICCYRSCDASNVHIHQQFCHNTVLNMCKIYKCPSEFDETNIRQLDFKELEKNIFKISCKVCFQGFYHTQLLINHLKDVHNVSDASNLKLFSCIYCPLTVENKNQIRIHVATKHSGELPLIYNHNTPCNNVNEDAINVLNILDLTETVAFEETISTDENVLLSEDVKPDLEDLMKIQEETIKVRLRKLTAHTGIPPDNLYRCPVTNCGGFFSLFDLWLKHMKVRHHSLECLCPHCPSGSMLQLDEFALHFEKHLRHTFICFHCSTTCTNETLARQHANQEHIDLGAMRFEQIFFNLRYSYFVMLKSSLFEERSNFIAEFREVLDKRLKDVETNEIQKFKHQWPVQDNAEWLDDYLQILSNRKVVRTCLIRDCQYRTLHEHVLFDHLRTKHDINGNSFNCSKCNFSVKLCTSFDEVFDHIRLHNDFLCICTACSLSTSSRSKMCSHIREQHTARDVPLIELFKTNKQMFVKVYIMFADNHLTFSTMKNCFCCSEKNMDGDVLSLHLKRYHKFSFTYNCEKCQNFQFTSLKDVKPHFQRHHFSNQFKIRCDLKSPYDLHVTSLNNFQVQISIKDQIPLKETSSIQIKEEPKDNNGDDDNDVILLEDDDIIIQDALKNKQQQQNEGVPKIKCASLSTLIETTKNTTCTMSSSTQSFQPNFPAMNQGYCQPATLSAHLTASLGPNTIRGSTLFSGSLQYDQNVSNHHSMNSVNAASSIYLTATSDPYASHYRTFTAVPNPPFPTKSVSTNLNTHTPHLPNNLYINSLNRTIITPNYTQNNI